MEITRLRIMAESFFHLGNEADERSKAKRAKNPFSFVDGYDAGYACAMRSAEKWTREIIAQMEREGGK